MRISDWSSDVCSSDLGYFIVKLDSIQRGDAGKQPAIVDAVKQQMSRVVGNEYVEQFARAAQADVGVKTNDAAVAKVKQQLRGRAEARRVGKGCVSPCRSRWAPVH